MIKGGLKQLTIKNEQLTIDNESRLLRDIYNLTLNI
jgi:hypothetical protein